MTNLFESLPVRRKEFERNLKREFAKMTQVLNAYCVISTGVRISCSNQGEKSGGRRTTVISTRGRQTLKDTIIDVFGPKSLSTLVEVATREPTEDDLALHGASAAVTGVHGVALRGYVSTCEHGKGRGSADRQFYFINGRPCDPTRVSKLVNELFRQQNKHQVGNSHEQK